ncbi:hypothetical protein TWF696_006825 [Orbilia brochopaga]|uniref:Uncharacterized protein n=1 Tax=Orbilia brochopaga TaxID=3140254 RepID=A0AAV9USH6_9PEZI
MASNTTTDMINSYTFRQHLDAAIAHGKPGIRIFDGVDRALAKQLSTIVSGTAAGYEGRFINFSYDASMQTVIIAMPSLAHECIAEFTRSCWRAWEPKLPPDHEDNLAAMTRPLYEINVSDDIMCVLEPEYSICYEKKKLPNLVIEAGPAEAYPQLIRNKDLWIYGTKCAVEVVLILKVSTLRDGTITAFLEIWRAEPETQRYIVLPKQENEEQPFLYLRDIYGRKHVPLVFDPNQKLPLSLDWLRKAIYKCARKKYQ